ncbi:MAG: hypothetical protein OXE73_09410 [Gammaproteobacteria bacterium]|nr:hypothetical protein [Gammaproteobacteria bacterium]
MKLKGRSARSLFWTIALAAWGTGVLVNLATVFIEAPMLADIQAGIALPFSVAVLAVVAGGVVEAVRYALRKLRVRKSAGHRR